MKPALHLKNDHPQQACFFPISLGVFVILRWANEVQWAAGVNGGCGEWDGGDSEFLNPQSNA